MTDAKDKRDTFRLEQAVRHARGNPASGLPPMDATDDGTPYMGDYSPAHDIYNKVEPPKRNQSERILFWGKFIAFWIAVALFVVVGAKAFGQGREIPPLLQEMGIESCDFNAAGKIGIVLDPMLKDDGAAVTAAVASCRSWLNMNRMLAIPSANSMLPFDKQPDPVATPEQ